MKQVLIDKKLYTHREGDVLILRESLWSVVSSLVVSVGSAALLIWLAWLVETPWLWFALVAALLKLRDIIRNAKHLVGGVTFKFDGITKTIARNEKRIANFGDVEKVQIRTAQENEDDIYRLSLVLTDQRKVFLCETTDKRRITEVAQQVAGLLDVELHRKVPRFSVLGF